MIEIKHLTKRYGELLAVDDISFDVAPGQVLGFLGPNGAGKSTTMKMITGFLSPTAGSVRVCGHDLESAPLAAKSCMGYLPEGAPSYPEMTVRSFLEFIADIRGLSADVRKRRLDDVIGRLALKVSKQYHGRPRRHARQRPQTARQFSTTKSPTSTWVTAFPADSTTPAAS